MFPMPLFVHHFDVIQEQIRQGRDGQQVLRFDKSAGIDGRMNGLSSARFQYRLAKIGLHQGLAPRQGNASAGIVVEDAILQNLGHDFTNGHTPPDHLASARGANCDALSALGALVAIDIGQDHVH
jgi:hypothetical protein